MNKTLIILASVIAVILLGSFLIPQSSIAPTVIQNPINNPINQTPINNQPVVTNPPVNNQPVACTMEAKQCPDGSYVSRTGPKCEFAMCPNATQTNTGTSAYIGQRILNNGVYISPLKVIEDSRCPSGVECIWAGTFKLLTKLEIGSKSEEIVLTLGTSVTFINKKITLTFAYPTQQGEVTNPVMQVFTFQVK